MSLKLVDALDIAVAIKSISRALDAGLIKEKDYAKLVAYLKDQAEKNGVEDNDYVNADEQIDLDDFDDKDLTFIAVDYLKDFKTDLNEIKTNLGYDMQKEIE